MVEATERAERVCTLVYTYQDVQSFTWHYSTRVNVNTKQRFIVCNVTGIDWSVDETFNEHFHTNEYAPHIVTNYKEALQYHFAPGLFNRRQHCPCDLAACATHQKECSFYRFPCYDSMAHVLTNCTLPLDGTDHYDRIVHVDDYEFKPPIGPLLLTLN